MKIRRIISAMTIIAMLAAFTGCGEENNEAEVSKEIGTKESVSTEAGDASGDTKTNSASEKTTDTKSETSASETSVSPSSPADEGEGDEAPEKITAEEGKREYKLDSLEGAVAGDSVKGSSDDKSGVTIDGIRNTFEAEAGEAYSDETFAEDTYGDFDSLEPGSVTTEEPIVPDDDMPYSYEPAIGLLTAGEWNDNDNWGFFTNLVNSQTITFPSYGIDPVHRTMITVLDDSKNPVVNANVQLLDDSDKELWQAVTDKEGKAYLFAGENDAPASVVVSLGDNKQSYELEKGEEVQENDQQNNQQKKQTSAVKDMEVTFSASGKAYKKTEIMFIVDATGSMFDEMLFLQTEFSGIAKEIGTQNTTYSVNFYRDEGDEYVTKCSPFTDDISKVQSVLNAETADGGGDTPEAVAEILDETITNGNWSEDSVKLAFLIFDAPPHYGKEEMLSKAIRTAAQKGIRLIPVVSSGSERDTELFGRAIAITTGGTYVFLTDDSGVGGSHLEPIIGDYEVEKLYDLIIRVIKDYQQ